MVNGNFSKNQNLRQLCLEFTGSATVAATNENRRHRHVPVTFYYRPCGCFSAVSAENSTEMCDVTKENFNDLFPQIEKDICDAKFVGKCANEVHLLRSG